MNANGKKQLAKTKTFNHRGHKGTQRKSKRKKQIKGREINSKRREKYPKKSRWAADVRREAQIKAGKDCELDITLPIEIWFLIFNYSITNLPNYQILHDDVAFDSAKY